MSNEQWREDIIKNKLGGKRDWTEEERSELCQQLDKEFDEKLNCKDGGQPIKDRWTEDNWKEKMAEHPIFSPYVQDETEIEGTAPINPLSEGLAQLKYHPDYNTPEEIARNYKEEGISFFKYKKYKFAVASFSEGIKQDFEDVELKSQLFSNRAASHARIGNNRSAIKDCEMAIKLKPDYKKVITRAVECAAELASWDEVIEWCDKGFSLFPDESTYSQFRKKALIEKKKKARDDRIKAKEIKDKENKRLNLIEAIKIRGVHFSGSEKDVLESLESLHPEAQGSCVKLLDDGSLVWPLIFYYPEYKEMDLVREYHENDRLSDHLERMFEEPPHWNQSLKYTEKTFRIFYENNEHKLVETSGLLTLFEVMQNGDFRIVQGTPYIIIMDNCEHKNLNEISSSISLMLEKYRNVN